MKFTYNGVEIYMDGLLATQLDSIAYNIKNDWDFLILITGDRTVRTGKSVLGMQISSYLAYSMGKMKLNTKYDESCIYFDSNKMLDEALHKPKYSIFHYDEGREALATSKYLSSLQRDILDYFAECGQLNQVFVIVMPDFFNLAEEIAVPRSEMLINVYRHEEKKMLDIHNTGELKPVVKLQRGRFQFFNKYKKQYLYDRSKQTKRRNFNLTQPNFLGRFPNTYPINETTYRKMKRDWLARFKKRRGDQKGTRTDIFRDTLIYDLHKDGKPSKDIRDYLIENYKYEISDGYVRQIINRIVKKGGKIATVSA